MSSLLTRGRRASSVMALASAALLVCAGLAQADVLKDDVSNGGGVGQHRTIAVGASTDLHYSLQAGGGCDASVGSPVTVAIQPDAGVTASPTSIQFTDCVSSITVTFSSNTAGVYDINHSAPSGVNTNAAFWILTVGDGGGTPDPCATGSDADNDGIVDACDTNSYAPAVGTQAPDANGYEGNTVSFPNPSTGGSFTDGDGNGTLIVTKTSGLGTLVDNGDGTFSWSILTTDDASGSVTVSASDGEHTPATQTFNWVAANVAPVIGTITTTPTGPCSVGLSAPYTDQGSGDTHSASINWGDSNSSTFPDPTTSPVTGSHTYTANGNYTINVTVTDDNGGVDSDNAPLNFVTKNSAGNFLEPVNINGQPRSVFKLGSTIPLKIKVTGCDGLAVTGLSPVISSIKVDSTAGDTINETTISTSTPTPGITMRWTGDQYLYNFSTKNSVLSNLPSTLTAGTYTVKASDPSFYAPATATFDLKK